ncbi:terminase small subunit [uncultured Marinobacter sp.]|uniref:terminase small subunit n=1 Tax=uncultured Marinobacter sp. TaxID=187379 RepID=UPI0025874882|nr:terminase small subunit [uncultured Marinobacter sp.]
MPKLTNPKREAFAQHYALHGNASDAYRHAYQTSRMKEDSIYQSASRLLKDVKVLSRVEELQAIAAKQADEQFKMDASWLLGRLQQIDELDIADVLDDSGNIRPISQWPKAWRTSISGVDLNELIGKGEDAVLTIVRKLKMPDKQKNLEMIGRHVEIQAFKDKVEHEHTGSFSIKELLQKAKEGR